MHGRRSSYVTLAVAAALVFVAGAAAAQGPPCPPDGRLKIAVTFTPPPKTGLAGVKVIVDYPEASVGIPGFQNWRDVKERVADLPAGFLSALNDTDTELSVGIAGTAVLPSGRLFTVDFDRCKGSAAVKAADFSCRVPEQSTLQGDLVEGAKCAVEIMATRPNDDSKRGN